MKLIEVNDINNSLDYNEETNKVERKLANDLASRYGFVPHKSWVFSSSHGGPLDPISDVLIFAEFGEGVLLYTISGLGSGDENSKFFHSYEEALWEVISG